MIRAGDHAIPAAYAAWVDVAHDAVVLIPPGCIDGTDKRAWSSMLCIAVHARPWQVSELILPVFLAVLKVVDL
jgi:hypothetical protein